MAIYEKKRFLIWGKTAPELSMKYLETVCTGAVLEDGSPIRLYSIPFRYLEGDDRFKKYQWATARIAPNEFDHRPESFRIECVSIELGNVIKPGADEWFERRQILFQQDGWQFGSVDALAEAQARTSQSLGVVTPQEILSVSIQPRGDDEAKSFEEKRDRIRQKWETQHESCLFEELMPPELKGLDFVKNRICVRWKCVSGKVHNMQIMDWETIELQRKLGDGKALEAVKKYLELNKYAVRFFLGNIKSHPTRFTIVGLWYPKRALRDLLSYANG